MSDGLFDVPGEATSSGGALIGASTPLAVRMRPATLDEVVGQDHLLQPGSPLRRMVEGSGAASVILYGPPGTGKTTLASLISQATGRRFEALSALSAGVKEVRAVIDVARRAAAHGEQTVLFIDEVHRFSKTQQDALLSAVENRVVLLVAATTENPSFSVVAPLLSRSLILQLQPLDVDAVRAVVRRAIDDPRGLGGKVKVTDEAVELMVQLSAGDARRALTALEVGAEAGAEVTVEVIEQSLDKAAVRYDRDGDQHYDVISAFIKSVRGSDVDAALHYLSRMLVAGEDPRFVARRLMILASEDIGMADPTALQTAVAAAQTVQLIGMPEAQLTLAHATVHLATAPKSNAVTTALGRGDERHPGGQGRTGPHPSARRPLLRRREARQRHRLQIRARRPRWCCAPAVSTRRTRRRRLLPADQSRRRTRDRGPAGQAACDHPQEALRRTLHRDRRSGAIFSHFFARS